MKGAYGMFPIGLRLSHAALMRNLRAFAAMEDGPGASIVTGSGDGRSVSRQRVSDYVSWYAEFLDVHHHGEDQHIFPVLRRGSQMRSTDIAHLDRWGSEHRDIFTLAEELRQAARRLGGGTDGALAAVRDRSTRLEAMLSPHLADEEAVLARGHLAEMIPEKDLERAQLAIPRSQGASALRSAAFLVHSLDPDEQQQLLGETPWLFRKVLLGWLGRPRVWRYGPLMPSREVAL